MPVQLPPAPPHIDLPPAPEDPPTIDDVIAAQRYQERVDSSRRLTLGRDGANRLDSVRAEIYKLEVIQAHRAESMPCLFSENESYNGF